MNITETRVKLVDNRNDRLKAFCSVTFDDDFVIRDLKIIEGTNGYFVAMPSRKLTDHCPACGNKNHLRAKYCNECGKRLKDNRDSQDGRRSTKLHADIAHPVNTDTRQYIQATLVEAFEAELERSQSPDYRPPSLDDLDDYSIPEPEKEPKPLDEPTPSLDEETEKPSNSKKTGFGEGIL